jgi:hypothetical protein
MRVGQVVLVLYHVCPQLQLFPHALHVISKRKLKCEIALTIATFRPRHGAAANLAQTIGAVREARARRRESQFTRDESHAGIRSSLITNHPPLPQSIASFCRVFGMHADSRRLCNDRNRIRA